MGRWIIEEDGMRFMGRILAIACVATLVSVGSWAQLSKGFKGKVLDRDGKPVADCPVVLEDLANSQNRYETKTNEKGAYLYTGVPFSDKGYKITIKIPNHPELPEVSKVEKPKMLEFTELDFDMRKDLVMSGGQVKPNPAAEAKKLYEMNDYEGALAKAEEAATAETDPVTLKVAGIIKASCLQNLGRTDDAIAAYESFNTSFPGNVDVLGNLAKLYEQKGDKAKADAYKSQFQAKGGKVMGEAYNEGVKAFNEGDMAKASESFEKALKEDPNDLDAERQLGIVYGATSEFQKAIPHLEKYLKARPDASDIGTVQAVLQYCKDQLSPPPPKKK
jgi:tetratricopeptide (TPR) repeat protein